MFAAIVKIAKEEMPFASCDIPLEHGPALIRVMTIRRAELNAEVARRKAYREHMEEDEPVATDRPGRAEN